MCLSNYIASCKKFSYEQVKELIEVKSKSGCKLLSDNYEKASQKLKLQCKCGNIFYTTLNSFFSNRNPKQQCNKCSNITNWDTELIKEYIINNSNVILLNDKEDLKYQSSLTLRCICGNIYDQKFNQFYNVKYKCCPQCMIIKRGINIRNSFEEVKQNIESIDGYILISKTYESYRKKLEIKCPEGHIFKMSYKNFYYEGCRCLVCNESEGIRIIKEWLNKRNIKFEQEYIFNDCCNLQPLLFDFAIFREDKLECLLEYDGQFHYLPINGQSKLIYQRINDSIKNKYCKNNNIKLIRIPYWENKNIHFILKEQLNDK